MVSLGGAHDVAAELSGYGETGNCGGTELWGHDSKSCGRQGVLHVSVGVLQVHRYKIIMKISNLFITDYSVLPI